MRTRLSSRNLDSILEPSQRPVLGIACCERYKMSPPHEGRVEKVEAGEPSRQSPLVCFAMIG